ncbi:MAG: hypothetical protein K0S33_315 [Bacteroidetes bacterium]|jgi:hypothetical protein|nr:hypothetical protein [Bacteroidota bacterium]
MNKKNSFLFFLLLAVCSVFAQDDEYVKEKFIRYQDWIYKPSIKTPQLRETSYELAPALIEFGSDEQLELSFDDLDGGYKNYNYTLIHCDASWNATDFVQSEYLTGFFEDNITNYAYSSNTIQQYTHYKVNFPNSGMKFSKSGNYIVLVYQDNNRENLVLSKRFMVYQNLVAIPGNVHQAARSDEYFDKQEVDFSIQFTNYNLTNPYTDMKVVITQNNRWDNAIYNLKPMFANLNELTYDYDDGSTCFNGGHEFRNFDDKSIKFYTQYIQKMYKDSTSLYRVQLYPEEVRTFKRYMQSPDLNGEFYIRTQEMDNNDTEADYCHVEFFFPYDTPLADGNFYITGKFCDWRLGKETRMSYNMLKKGYECELFLKQGFYNYQYVYAKDGKSAVDETMIEGNHWETENDYTIYVYHRKLGTYYDQLIGVKKLNSIRK